MVGQGSALQGNVFIRGLARQGLAWQGLAGHDKARLGSNLEEALWTARCM